MLCMHIVETLYWLHYKAHDQLSWCTKGSANIKPLPELGFELWSPSTKDNYATTRPPRQPMMSLVVKLSNCCVVLCCVVLCCVVLCCVVLCCVVLCCVVLCCVVLCYVMLCYVMLCYDSFRNTIVIMTVLNITFVSNYHQGINIQV